MLDTKKVAPGYTGLTELTESLPADAYFDPHRYAREGCSASGTATGSM